MKTLLSLALAGLSALPSLAGSERYVAHEWGTFTSVQGDDGRQLEWNPLQRTDLPGFVYDSAKYPGGLAQTNPAALLFSKSVTTAFLRMETPVIYFYSDRERTVDVTVRFPQGRMTEWYPQATFFGPYLTGNAAERARATNSLLEWKGMTILAPDTKEITASRLIREKGGSHYYEARETDANFLRMKSPYASRGATEYERDLFYRGIGFLRAPLHLELRDGLLRASTESPQPLEDLFALTIRNGQAAYTRHERLNKDQPPATWPAESQSLAPLTEVRPRMMAEMTAALIRQGLFPREAQAMVETWKDQWFSEEGTRVLYLLPVTWTEQALPLTIEPRPQATIRVMVGRAEMIPPRAERELRMQISRYAEGDKAARRLAITEARATGLGRFLEPAVRKILGSKPPAEFARAAWELVQQASLPAEDPHPKLVRN